MKELIRVLLEDTELLDQIRPEEISDNEGDVDRVLVLQMKELKRGGMKPTAQALRDLLEGNDYLLEQLNERLQAEVLRDPQFILLFIKNSYNERLLNKMFMQGPRMLMNHQPSEVWRWVQETGAQLTSETRHEPMEKVSTRVFNSLEQLYIGGKRNIFVTGYPEVDDNIAFGPEQIVVVAAMNKVGKTRWVRNMFNAMLRHNPDRDGMWFHYEMGAQQMLSMDIAEATGISTAIVQGKKRLPEDAEFHMIMQSRKLIEERKASFYGKPDSITGICREIEKYANENTVVVIDNLGTIKPEPNMDPITNDKYIAAQLMETRDKTGACIIVIHHLTKAVNSFFNEKNNYEPTRDMVSGSTRIVDFCNSLLLLHRVSLYSALQKNFTPDVWETMQKRILIKCEAMRDGAPSMAIKMGHDIECCRFFSVPQ